MDQSRQAMVFTLIANSLDGPGSYKGHAICSDQSGKDKAQLFRKKRKKRK